MQKPGAPARERPVLSFTPHLPTISEGQGGPALNKQKDSSLKGGKAIFARWVQPCPTYLF